MWESFVYKFDSKGKPIEVRSYKDSDFIDRTVYKYDDRGNAIESVLYDANGKIESREVSVYDESGNVVESHLYGVDGMLEGREVNKYDDRGNEVEVVSYDANGEIEYSEANKYDNRGRPVESVVSMYHSEEDLPRVTSFKLTHKYRVFSNTVETTMYRLEENRSTNYVQKYNRDGSTDEIIIFGRDWQSKIKFEYEHDERGNVIFQKSFRIRDGVRKLSSETFYEYTYWDE